MTQFERYGTVLRIWDYGPNIADRYTILPPRWDKESRRHGGGFDGIACNACPFHPQGLGQHVFAVVPGKHLGKRIRWDELPGDAQRFARQEFPDYAPAVD